MSLVKIKIIYDYYSSKRVTPVFVREEELLNLCFDEFKARLLTEVPYLNKMASSLRLTIIEDNLEVDLSSTYFNFQIKGILEKEKTITVKAFVFDSPGYPSLPSVQTGTRNVSDTRNVAPENAHQVQSIPQAKRSLTLTEGHVYSSDSDSESSNPPNPPQDSCILLPLERYAKKQKQTAKDIQCTLQIKRQELAKSREKLNIASYQNVGNGATCGNCHLKLGHTKKSCEYSPCKSAYSCGSLTKHGSEKMAITTLERETVRLERSLTTAQNEIQNAERAADKVLTSVPKWIEEVIVKELSDRYISFGRRNWILLNRDVATLQKNLQGKLPSRENITKLLHRAVLKSSNNSNKVSSSSAISTDRITDRRMSSQKRLLSEEYGINFPTDKTKRKKNRSLPFYCYINADNCFYWRQ